MSIIEYDIAIVGGGTAGLSLASFLKLKSEYSVLVVEAGNYDRVKVGETLAPQARTILEEIGIWNTFQKAQHVPSLGMQSSWQDEDIQFNDYVYSLQGHGWHLDRLRFEKDLYQRAESLGVLICTNHNFVKANEQPFGWEMEVLTPFKKIKTIYSSYVVDASGRNARFAFANGITNKINDQLTGCFKVFSSNRSSAILKGHTLVEATEHGWWYSAPIPDQKLIIGFMSDLDIVKKTKSFRNQGWTTLLAQSKWTKNKITGFKPETRIINRSARTERLNQFSGNRWIAIGDAAMAFDPLSAQGITKALFNAQQSSFVILDALNGNKETSIDYNRKQEQFFSQYLNTRQHYYKQVQRWPNAPFWQRRQLINETSPPILMTS